MKQTATALAILAAVALAPLPSSAANLWVVKEGKLIKEGLDWTNFGPEKEMFWKTWVHSIDET